MRISLFCRFDRGARAAIHSSLGVALVGAVVALWVPSLGCVSSEVTAIPCQRNSECPEGQTCDQAEGFCVDEDEDAPRGRQPNVDAGPLDPPGPGPNDDAGDPSDPSDPPDGGDVPDPTDPDGGGGPGPTDPPGGACDTQGQPCTLTEGVTIRAAGSNFCARTSETQSQCLVRCAIPFASADCPDRSVCWEVEVSAGVEENLCIPSECSDFRMSDSQCGGDNCLLFAEETGLCSSVGVVVEGGTCMRGATADAQRCGAGTFCRFPSAAESSGVCARLCDFWAPSPSACPGGETCGTITLAQGMCAPLVPGTPLAGDGSAVPCDTPGQWCADRSRCIQFNTADGPTNVCATYCRRGRPGDCVSGLTCNWNVFPDTTRYGLCLPPCSDANPCPDGQLCSMGVCSRACAADDNCDTGDICFDNVCKRPPT